METVQAIHQDSYMLKTGAADADRLALLEAAYGASTDEWLNASGLSGGMRVVEFGCGSGNVTARLARAVGPGGKVVGVDLSPRQIELAEERIRALGLNNVSFQVADISNPGLTPKSFDLAYCRLVLMHTTDPVGAIRSMRDLVREGGTVVCEEMDLSRWVCDPMSPAVERCFELKLALGSRRGVNFQIGPMLHRLFEEAGLTDPLVGSAFALSRTAQFKQSNGLSLQSLGSALISHELIDTDELDRLVTELLRLADDPNTLFGLPMMFQCRATC